MTPGADMCRAWAFWQTLRRRGDAAEADGDKKVEER